MDNFMEGKYNIYKIRVDDFKAVMIVESNVKYSVVDKWESRPMNEPLDYFLAGYEVGSPRDIECANDLK